MKTALLLTACLTIVLGVQAQKETFDLSVYEPPAGWKKQVTEHAVSFSSVDEAARSWCQVAIYKSAKVGGDAKGGFASEWKVLVKPETYRGAGEPVPVVTVKDGWSFSRGTSTFTWEGKDAYATLYTAFGNGIVLSAFAATNSVRYDADIEKFFQSVRLKPLQPVVSPPATAVVISQIVKQTAAATPGILTATTNFDDGWVAQPFADYVRLTRNGTTVLLHYTVAVDDAMRQAPNMAANVWERIITSRYRGDPPKTYQNENYSFSKIWFAENTVTDLAANKVVHVGLRVLVENGVATPIEIISPSAAVFQTTFPTQESIAAMTSYNKFAVAPGDIVGTWQESSSSSLAYYNTVSGTYAGNNTAASANTFTFRPDGTYDSHHKGASGMTGNLKFYDEKFTGKYTLAPWETSMTNRFEGRTDVFSWQYRAVRGGRVLEVNNKAFSGIRYSLVKTN